jgi:hypothetical protein
MFPEFPGQRQEISRHLDKLDLGDVWKKELMESASISSFLMRE